MNDRMQLLSAGELTRIHDASMHILGHTGIDFNHDGIADIFKSNGFRTEGTKIFFREKDVHDALKTTVSEFTVRARNPEHTLRIGNDAFVFVPTGGATHVAGIDGTRRPGTLADFQDCCKLVQTSDQIDMGGYLMVLPQELPPETVNMEMMLLYLTLCDKPIFGSSGTGEETRETIEMAAIIFGGMDKLMEQPVMVAVANTLTPLRFAGSQGDVILAMARARQPVVISNMILAGVSGPVTLPEMLALENAEILAGVVLTQLVNPGTPVLYGSSSAPIDMRTMVSAAGAAEAVKIAAATIQLARFYHLPCRAGGGLTDSHLPDAQAMAEASLMLSTVVRNGANFIYHAAGQMGSYISMGFEKWLLDEEVCRLTRKIISPIMEPGAAVNADLVNEVGMGGQYLTHPSTFRNFRTLSETRVFNRKDHTRWEKSGGLGADETAAQKLADRLESYEKPPIDPGLEAALTEYVNNRKAGILPATDIVN